MNSYFWGININMALKNDIFNAITNCRFIYDIKDTSKSLKEIFNKHNSDGKRNFYIERLKDVVDRNNDNIEQGIRIILGAPLKLSTYNPFYYIDCAKYSLKYFWNDAIFELIDKGLLKANGINKRYRDILRTQNLENLFSTWNEMGIIGCAATLIIKQSELLALKSNVLNKNSEIIDGMGYLEYSEKKLYFQGTLKKNIKTMITDAIPILTQIDIIEKYIKANKTQKAYVEAEVLRNFGMKIKTFIDEEESSFMRLKYEYEIALMQDEGLEFLGIDEVIQELEKKIIWFVNESEDVIEYLMLKSNIIDKYE